MEWRAFGLMEGRPDAECRHDAGRDTLLREQAVAGPADRRDSRFPWHLLSRNWPPVPCHGGIALGRAWPPGLCSVNYPSSAVHCPPPPLPASLIQTGGPVLTTRQAQCSPLGSTALGFPWIEPGNQGGLRRQRGLDAGQVVDLAKGHAIFRLQVRLEPRQLGLGLIAPPGLAFPPPRVVHSGCSFDPAKARWCGSARPFCQTTFVRAVCLAGKGAECCECSGRRASRGPNPVQGFAKLRLIFRGGPATRPETAGVKGLRKRCAIEAGKASPQTDFGEVPGRRDGLFLGLGVFAQGRQGSRQIISAADG